MIITMYKLHICIVATSLYNKYLDYFFKSLKNLKLKNFEYDVIVISNTKPEYDCLYYPIAHLPYPFVTYFKPLTIKHALLYFNISDKDYFMFVDADTIIRKIDNFDVFEEALLSNKLIFTISPWSYFKFVNENKYNSFNYKEVYIEDFVNKRDFIQASFFAGRINEYNDFCDDYFNLVQEFSKDWLHKRIPPMNDQSIICKLVHDNMDKFITDYFIVNTYEDYNIEAADNSVLKNAYCKCKFIMDDNPHVFLIQKFNKDIKSSIRLYR